MKRMLRWTVGLLGSITMVAGLGGVYLFARYPHVPPAENLRVDATPERLARGRYLFDHAAGCIDCHSTRDWTKYGGPVIPGTIGKGGDLYGTNLGLPGNFYARNITPAGVGDWTDGELVRAITTGVDRNNEPLFPIMPYQKYGQMDKDDIEAIVAYMRTLPAIQNTVPAHTFTFPMQLIVRTLPAPARYAPKPDPSDRVRYGGYLAAGCSDCHTPSVQGTPIPGKDFAGGMEFPLPGGGYVRAANLTSDAITGIGSWTEQQFVEKFKLMAEAPDQVPSTPADQRKNTVMPWKVLGGMTRDDLAAIYAYLRSLPPVVNRVQKHSDTPLAQ
jgi:mono/diheme cytochrome c family protein